MNPLRKSPGPHKAQQMSGPKCDCFMVPLYPVLDEMTSQTMVVNGLMVTLCDACCVDSSALMSGSLRQLADAARSCRRTARHGHARGARAIGRNACASSYQTDAFSRNLSLDHVARSFGGSHSEPPEISLNENELMCINLILMTLRSPMESPVLSARENDKDVRKPLKKCAVT